MVNTAVLAPIPRARERIATAAKTGDLASDRRAYRNSPDKFMDTPHVYLQVSTAPARSLLQENVRCDVACYEPPIRMPANTRAATAAAKTGVLFACLRTSM